MSVVSTFVAGSVIDVINYYNNFCKTQFEQFSKYGNLNLANFKSVFLTWRPCNL
jgi:hypothetical protein